MNIHAGFRYYGISCFVNAEAKVTTIVKVAWVPNANNEIVFFMTASFNFELELKTAASLELKSHKNGIDLVVCHDGVVLELGLSADIKKEIDEQSPDEIGYSSSSKDYELYEIADPLKLEDSDLRFNLIGEIKQVPKRERQRIRSAIPPGANPGFKLKY